MMWMAYRCCWILQRCNLRLSPKPSVPPQYPPALIQELMAPKADVAAAACVYVDDSLAPTNATCDEARPPPPPFLPFLPHTTCHGRGVRLLWP